MEDNQNGRLPKWKKMKMEDDQKGRRTKWKTTKIRYIEKTYQYNQLLVYSGFENSLLVLDRYQRVMKIPNRYPDWI